MFQKHYSKVIMNEFFFLISIIIILNTLVTILVRLPLHFDVMFIVSVNHLLSIEKAINNNACSVQFGLAFFEIV